MQLMSRARAASLADSSQAAEPTPASEVGRDGDKAAIGDPVNVCRANVIELTATAGVSAESEQTDEATEPQSIEQQVRAAMIAAASAVMEPWLEANFGRTVERCLGGRLQKIASEVISNRLLQEVPPIVAEKVGAMEKRIGAAVMQTIAHGIEEALEPALGHQLVALETRITDTLGEQITNVLVRDLHRELDRQLADAKAALSGSMRDQIASSVTAEVKSVVAREVGEAEGRLTASLPEHVSAATAVAVPRAVDGGLARVESALASALPEQVTLAVDKSIGPAVESRVRAAEAQMSAAMGRQVRSEIGSIFKRLAKACTDVPRNASTPPTFRTE